MNTGKEKSLYLVYRFTSQESSDQLRSASVYQILYFYSNRGHVPENVLKKVFSELFLSDRQFLDGFYSLDELELFAQQVAQQIEAPDIYLISNHDYNSHMQEVYNVRGVKDVFHMQGKCIRNSELENSSKGFFSKLF